MSRLSALAGGEAPAMQCHELFCGAKLQRSNQKRGKQANEHGRNQRRMEKHCWIS
jgi:hypothetical protein